jgi:hypothetical protein
VGSILHDLIRQYSVQEYLMAGIVHHSKSMKKNLRTDKSAHCISRIYSPNKPFESLG